MKVLIVNTSERTGGAAVAAHRLMEALNANGVKAKMLVGAKESDNINVCEVPCRRRVRWHFLWERLCIWVHLHFRRRHLFEIDMANAGSDITRLPEFREADIIHLHWVNQGLLSLGGIRRILESGKPVVWTMHDIWPATAICHLTLGCERFKTACQYCQLLPGGGSARDLSAAVWRRKQRLLAGRRVTFVACSQWLADEARQSALLKGQAIYAVPNPINTHVYHPGDKAVARQRLALPPDDHIILFVSQRATNPNKGMQYLVEACRLLAARHPDMKENTTVAVLGGHAEEVTALLPFRAVPLGYVSDEQRIVSIYQAADVFVLPSLSENLPNTIMESMACGLPSVAFRVGGIPEEIDHRQNGYVADYCSADDLAAGIRWALFESDPETVGKACLDKVAHCYSMQHVARQYIEVYEAAKRPRIVSRP